MTRIALKSNTVTPCMDMDPEMFFPQGKRQHAAVRQVCQGCPTQARKTCFKIAENMQVLGDDGRVVDGATGVFGGVSWKMGTIID